MNVFACLIAFPIWKELNIQLVQFLTTEALPNLHNGIITHSTASTRSFVYHSTAPIPYFTTYTAMLSHRLHTRTLQNRHHQNSSFDETALKRRPSRNRGDQDHP